MTTHICFAQKKDSLWLKSHDLHTNEDILMSKIENKEILVIEIWTEIIWWLRFNYFWDEIPFVNMLYILENFREKGYGKEILKYWEDLMWMKWYKNLMTSSQGDEQGQYFYRKLWYKDIWSFNLPKEAKEILFLKQI